MKKENKSTLFDRTFKFFFGGIIMFFVGDSIMKDLETFEKSDTAKDLKKFGSEADKALERVKRNEEERYIKYPHLQPKK